MSQDDYLFERLTKESERAKINQVLAAIVTNNSGDGYIQEIVIYDNNIVSVTELDAYFRNKFSL